MALFFFFLNIWQIIEFVFKFSSCSFCYLFISREVWRRSREYWTPQRSVCISSLRWWTVAACTWWAGVRVGEEEMPHKHTHSYCAVTPRLPQNAPATDSCWRLCSAALSYEANPFFMALTTPVTIEKNSLLWGKLCICSSLSGASLTFTLNHLAGLRPGRDRAVLRWTGRLHLPRSLLLHHCSHVQLYSL